jgi:hypothetical protein
MLQLLQSLPGVCAEYKKVRADIKKRTAEAQRWQKKAKKIRSGMAGGNGGMMGQNPNGNGSGGANDRQLNAANQELLRAADAAQIDLNSRLALLQVTIFSLSCVFDPMSSPPFHLIKGGNTIRRLLRQISSVVVVVVPEAPKKRIPLSEVLVVYLNEKSK